MVYIYGIYIYGVIWVKPANTLGISPFLGFPICEVTVAIRRDFSSNHSECDHQKLRAAKSGTPPANVGDP